MVTKEECVKCRERFQSEKISCKNTKTNQQVLVPSKVEPPCEWVVTKFTFDGRAFKASKPPCLDGKEWLNTWFKYEIRAGIETFYPKNNTLAMLSLCPKCGCIFHSPSGLNWKCDNCGRTWRKSYSPTRGRPPLSEEERRITGGGTYRRKARM